MRIKQITVRANREYADFQHAKVEIVLDVTKGDGDLTALREEASEIVSSFLDTIIARLRQPTADPIWDAKTTSDDSVPFEPPSVPLPAG